MGAPRVPTKLKILRGTDQPCRMIENEPDPSEEGIEMPKSLTGDAKKCWLRTLPLLQAVRVMTVNDVDALKTYCLHMANMEQAFKMINKHGAVTECPETGLPLKRSPWFEVMKDSSTHITVFLREFGMTPASRTKVSAIGKQKKSDGFNSF